jgi:hypothetical protein
MTMSAPVPEYALVVPNFLIDWHPVALPIIRLRSPDDPLFVFKRWLANMLILRQTPNSVNLYWI